MLILENPNQQQLDIIYREFNATPEAVQKDVISLIEWLEKQPHLPNIKDEDLLTHCLLRCKNRMEQVKIVLDRYFSLKTVMPNIYENRDPMEDKIISSMKALTFIPLPRLTDDGCRISIFRVLDTSKYEQIDPDNVIKSMFMTADIRLKIDACNADIYLFDLQNITLPVITMMMANLRKFILPGTRGIPLRQRTYYIINASSVTESLIMMAKSFLRKNLLKKLVVLKNPSDLLNVLPKQSLPRDYGGNELSFNELNDSWIETLQYYKEWFKEQEYLKADNSKRLNRIDSKLGDFPLDGSFRMMTID